MWRQPIGDPVDESPASGPVLGDVDADGSLEVVVAWGIQDPGGAVTIAGGFWALDDSSGTVEQSVTSDAFRIRGETKSLPPAAVTLGELRNGDSGLEMIAGGGRYGENLHDDDEM